MGKERVAATQEPWQPPKWFVEACNLSDGAQLGGVLMAALQAELHVRAVEAGAGDDWPTVALSGLEVRKANLPDWWLSNGNLLIGATDSKVELLSPFLFAQPNPTGALIALGAGVTLNRASASGSGAIAAFGDHCNVPGVGIALGDRSTISIGEGTSATFGALLDARNGGAIIVGADGMWADGLAVMTDDCHAIRDLQTGTRINVFGGRVVVGRHVWFSSGVSVLGDCQIGADTVVGTRALVKNCVLPPNSVCVGQPAKPIRNGTTWSRRDEP